MYFTPQLSNFGGIERTITDKANYLTEIGHQVSIVTYEQLNRPYAYNLSKKVHHVDLDNSFNLLYRYPIYIRLFKYLLLLFSVKTKLKNFIRSYSPDVIVVTTPDTEHYLRIIFSVSKGIKIVLESHNTFDNHFIEKGFWCKFSYFFQNPKQQYRKAALMIALTKGDAQNWRTFNVNSVRVIPNPVSFYCEDISNLKKTAGQIIAVGRLHEGKRFDRLITAFSLIAKKYSEWHLNIFGVGEQKEYLNNLISKLDIVEQVNISYAKNDIVTEYKKSHFMVISSDYEGFSLVLIEAMACGLPCVSTACPYGPLEIIEDGVTGLLAKLDESDLAKKIEWMITHEKERQEMGVNAHKSASRYKMDHVMKEWEEAYLSVI